MVRSIKIRMNIIESWGIETSLNHSTEFRKHQTFKRLLQ